MQVRQLQIGDFRRMFITVSVHLICLQHVRRNSARRTGLSATADPHYFLASFALSPDTYAMHMRSELLCPPIVMGMPLYFAAVVSIFLLSSSFSSPILSGRRLDVYHISTQCCLSANLERMSEMCCTRLAANTGRKKSPKIRHLGTIAQLRRAVSSQLNDEKPNF